MNDPETDKEVKGKFEVKCKKCGKDALIEFDAGYIHCNGGDTGCLTVSCKDCDEEVYLH